MKGQKQESPLFNSLAKLVSVIDSFRDLGLHQYIQLPRIAVCGVQSGGKSSLLQNIVGMDFLPRGSGVVTRRPLELRLKRLEDQKQSPYGIFEVEPKKKYFNFDDITKKIEAETDRIAGTKKQIVDDPILLTVYSPQCPDLTMIDLPGITKVDIDGQADIQKITKGLMAKYCEKNQRTIMLCVAPANQDLSTSDAIYLARQWDPEGKRTIGCITKIDIMDRGTDACSILSNNQYPLKLGYVAIKNRSQEDINNKVKVAKSLDDQDKYFSTHPKYSRLNKDALGTRALVKKLTTVLFKSIREHLPKIIGEINSKISQCEHKLKELGPPLPSKSSEKIQYIWSMLSKLSDQYKCRIRGKYDPNVTGEDISGGALIKFKFEELYEDFASPKYSVTAELSDDQIQDAIKMHEGDSIPGFPSIYSFLFLLTPKLKQLKEPAIQLLNFIYQYLRDLTTQLANSIFSRFREVNDVVIELVDQCLAKQKSEAKHTLDAILESEINYIFTNNAEYLEERTKLFPFEEEEKPLTEKADEKPKPKLTSEQLAKRAEQMFVKEMRMRVDTYFRITIATLREIVPKIIGNSLVRKSQQNLQYFVYNEIRANSGLLDSVGEDPSVTLSRETTAKAIQTLKKARNLIRKDFDVENPVIE